VTNTIALRSNARNAIITYSALQKVFRARFEDGRSHATLDHLAHLGQNQPFLTTERPSYETALGKNRLKFAQINFFKKENKLKSGELGFLLNTTSFPFFNFPFLLAPKSDMGRYL